MATMTTTCWKKLLLLNFLTLSPTTFHVHGLYNEQKDFHPQYWNYVAQAIQYAKCVETEVLPTLDDGSLIMKPAACRKESSVDGCSRCTEEAKTLNGTSTSMDFFQQVEAPKPLFHCTSHVGVHHSSPHKKGFKTHFRMEYPSIHQASALRKDQLPRVFVVEKEVDGVWEAVSLQPYWLFPLDTKNGSTYRTRVTAVSPIYVYYPQISDYITLYDAAQQTIGTPKNFRVVDTRLDRKAARPSPKMTLRWESGSGKNASCDFDVFYMDDEEHKVERSKPEDAFWVVLDNVNFGKKYSIHLMELFGFGRETQKATLRVTVPSCLVLHDYNFNACPPPMPTNIRVENETSSSFWVAWDHSQYQNASNRITSYELTIDRLPDAAMYKIPKPIFSGQVSGDVNNVEITNVTTKAKIRISIVAKSQGGKSLEGWHIYQLKGDTTWTRSLEKFWVIIVIVVLLVMSIVVIFYLKSFRDRLHRNRATKERWKKWDEEASIQQAHKYSSKWEIDFGNLILHDVVGRGQFGEVRKATLHRKGSKTTVAVKTIRVHSDTAPEEYDVDDGTLAKDIIDKFFREEFDILKGIEPHMHVVGLIGIVRDPVPALVVEYCDGGDLLVHLRKASQPRDKRRSPSSSRMGSSVQLQPNAEIRVQLSMVTNEAYFMKNEIESTSPLTPLDLLSYARQIACGMEFLSHNKILHRDLAARNILINGRNRILKIADFGMSRDVYEQNCYKKRSSGKIPVKWLAIESVLKGIYTTKSDVWSYGIVLWEIVTLGGSPYPGTDNMEIFDLLRSGYRMVQPQNCSQELYELMRRCWDENPNARPDFTSIRRKLEEIIGNYGDVTYLNLDSTGTVLYSELESVYQGSIK